MRAAPIPRRHWLLELVLEELAPYPGRFSLAARMALSSTLTMFVIETFHLPAGALGGFFALLFSRQDFRATLEQSISLALCFSLGTLYVILTLAVTVDSPVTHFLWVLASLYLCFFVIGASRVYPYAAGFAFTLAGAIPLWDGTANVNQKVALTLYTLLSVAIASGVTIVVEAVYLAFRQDDLVIAGLADRLRVSGAALLAASEGRAPSPADQLMLSRYAAVGASALRQQLLRSQLAGAGQARASAAIAMADRITGLSAEAMRLGAPLARLTLRDRAQLRDLGATLGRQSAAIKKLGSAGQLGSAALPGSAGGARTPLSHPLLREVARSVRLLGEVYNALRIAGVEAEQVRRRAPAPRRGPGFLSLLFVDGALGSKQKHLFALRGTIAASLCYLAYNGVNWPGINTALATCIITALGTVGASRQKQILRISGAIVGGFLIGLPAQVLLLPRMDSITAFAVFFTAVTVLASWIATSSPRLSYFGLQIALAFDLINLQEPFRQTSLAIGRDRVVGVLLGLVAMWLVFDQLAAPRSSDTMDTKARELLRLLGEAAGLVSSFRRGGGKSTTARFDSLRGAINAGFAEMNSQADAVLFEWGPERARSLYLRDRVLQMQTPMRSAFLLLITLYDVTPVAKRLGTIARTTPLLAPFLDRCREALTLAAELRVARRNGRLESDPRRREALEQACGRAGIALENAREVFARESPTLLSLCEGLQSSLAHLLAGFSAPDDETEPTPRHAARAAAEA